MQVNYRREARRQAGGLHSVCWQNGTGATHSAEVEALDISKSGIAVRCDVEISVATPVYIESRNGPLKAHCKVRSCAPAADGYRLGLEFDNPADTGLAAPESRELDYYEFLQISPKAEPSTIERVYRFMASRFHPDNQDTGDAEKFILLNKAYQVLSDAARRAEYDAKREASGGRLNPIFEMSEFVNGIEGETNRRLGVLSLLYNKRRSDPSNPSISLYDLEKRMGWPREYLDFTTWYLRNKEYITRADNSDFTLTVTGVDFVESNYSQNAMLKRLLNSGPTATSAAENGDRNSSGDGDTQSGRELDGGDEEPAK